MAIWYITCSSLISPDDKIREYLKQRYRTVLNSDVFDLNLVAGVFNEVDDAYILQSYFGFFILTSFASISISIIGAFGVLIVRKLAANQHLMSEKSRDLQRQLMKALAVQTCIPVVFTLTPCSIVWILPIFGIDLEPSVSLNISIGLSFFPALDPLALFYFVPVFRKRLREILGLASSSVGIYSLPLSGV